MFNKMYNKKNRISKEHKDLLEIYNAEKAHQEMVIKSGGGFSGLIDLLDTKDDIIIQMEDHIIKLDQTILYLNREISNLEKNMINLVTSYRFLNGPIIFEINKSYFIDRVKNTFFYKKVKLLLYLLYKIKYIIIIFNILIFLKYKEYYKII